MKEKEFKLKGCIRDSYYRYKKLEKYIPITRTEYCSICIEFNRIISDKIIKESFEYKIPYGLGTLRIKANKIKYKFKDNKLDISKMRVDWKKTLILWKKLYPGRTKKSEYKDIPNKKLVVYTNEHTDGYIMRWYWDKTFAKFINMSVYKFKPVKGGLMSDNNHTGKLGLATWIKNKNRTNEYYE